MIVAVVALAGCASPAADTTSTSPLELVNVWRVEAPGESSDTWVKFESGNLTTWSDCGIALGSWRAASRTLVSSLTGSIGGSMCSDYANGLPDWLYDATSFTRVNDAHYRLLASDGTSLADLTIDGLPPTSSNYSDSTVQPTKVTDDTRAAFAEPAPLPIEATAVHSLDGRWIPSDAVPGYDAFVDFDGDTWTSSDGCNGMNGRFLVGDDGLFLATSGGSTLIGCDNSRGPEWVQGAARAGMVSDNLTLYDRSGKQLGYFTRA